MMMKQTKTWYSVFLLATLSCLGLQSCKHHAAAKEPVFFEGLNADRTGLGFINKLTPTQEFNVFKYMYFYNGGGAIVSIRPSLLRCG